MAQKILTEQEVKDALGISSFRNMSKEKIMEFVSLIPNMDKDVAIAVVNQFPAYSTMAKCIVEELTKSCDTAMKENTSSQQQVLSAYRKILDDLGEVLKRENITPEERESISEKMIYVAIKMDAKDTENKTFISWLQKNKNYVLGAVAVIGGVILGVNIKGKNIPKV